MANPTPHYYPFGSLIQNRSWSDASREYRCGFNGKEKDFETAADNYDFGARIYDGRLGRWLSVDPLARFFSSDGPYHYCFNSPLNFIDSDGEQPRPPYRNYQRNLLFNTYYPITTTRIIVSLNLPYNNNAGRPPGYKPPYVPPPNYVTSRPGHNGGMYNNQNNPFLVVSELLLDIGETQIRIQKQSILFEIKHVRNTHGITTTTIVPFLPHNSPEWIELNKQEKAYQEGLAARKKAYIDNNKPKWDSEYYNRLTTPAEKAAYKKQYDQKMLNFNIGLAANLAGIEIQYTLQNGISPMQKFKQEAMKLYDTDSRSAKVLKTTITVQPVLYEKK